MSPIAKWFSKICNTTSRNASATNGTAIRWLRGLKGRAMGRRAGSSFRITVLRVPATKYSVNDVHCHACIRPFEENRRTEKGGTTILLSPFSCLSLDVIAALERLSLIGDYRAKKR